MRNDDATSHEALSDAGGLDLGTELLGLFKLKRRSKNLEKLV